MHQTIERDLSFKGQLESHSAVLAQNACSEVVRDTDLDSRKLPIS